MVVIGVATTEKSQNAAAAENFRRVRRAVFLASGRSNTCAGLVERLIPREIADGRSVSEWV
jgi:hypothetical protein